MIDISKLELRKLDFEGAETLVNWARNEGWNPGPKDAEVFWKTDPEGFFGYIHNNELIAGGAIVSYEGKLGFMGLFIVKPEFRSLGIGQKLWYQRRDLLISRLDKNCSIGMDGVVEMQPFYEKGGFKKSFVDRRFENTGKIIEVSDKISKIEKADYENIKKYDSKCFGLARPQFIFPWLEIEGNFNYKYKSGDELKGYCVMRKATEGYKIGPLFAESPSIAEELYKSCLNSAPGDKIYVDIPMINKNAKLLVEKYKASYVFECARMYYGSPPHNNINNVFGITSFELG